MIKSRKVFILLTMLTSVILLIAGGCEKDDSSQNKTYNLMVKDVLGVSGTVTFTESGSNSTTIDIMLANAPSGTHPANLYMNSVVENGAVIVALNPVDATGKSSTVVKTMTYSQLIAYDGSIKVFKITTTNKTYMLTKIGVFNVSGTALLEKRENGNTLVTVSLTGIIPGESYPATINLGSITSVGGGPVVKLLNNVSGTTGKSYTNIQKLDGGTNITYENWLVYDGYLNVYQESILLSNVICNGNIGSN